MKKRIGIFLAALLLLSSCGRDSGRLKMGAAGLGGTYQAFSDAFAKLESETNNREIEVRTTAGSAANLRLLSQNYIQLALCQADLLEDAWNGTGQFQGTEPIRGFGAVAGVYEEACQIVVRADSEISTVEELEGHRVSIGEEESGTKQNALQILAAYGLNEKLVEEVSLNYTEAAKELENGTIDAFFCTAGVQTAAITNLAQRTGIRFLNVDNAAAARLKKSYPVYDSCIIAAGTYPGQEEDVSTVGVKAVLLASDSVSAEVVEELTALLFEEQQELDFALPVELITDADAAVAGISVPFHKGAERYYESRGEKSENWTGYVSDNGSCSACSDAWKIFKKKVLAAGAVLNSCAGNRRCYFCSGNVYLLCDGNCGVCI